jgi:hypothetical protein
MASEDIFSFLNDLYDLLPDRDRARFGELWKAYEQTYGDVWMKMFERELASDIDHVPLYNNQRWLQHKFDATTQVNRAATYRSNQDLSKGINLSSRYLIKFAIDGGSAVEVDLRGANPVLTLNTEIVSKINAAAGFSFSRLVVLDSLLDFKSSTAGPASRITFYPASSSLLDASALILGLDPLDLPISYPRFPYEYQLLDRFIVGVPELQDKIHDDQTSILLTEGTDYVIEFGSGVISFQSIPVASLWARDNLVNLETPFNNFGYLLDIYDTNTPAYLKAVKGLWFAFWTGPRPENIRRSLYLLFGLPTATFAGTVSAITSSVITLTYADSTTEDFSIPLDLTPLVALGASVTRFQPLVSGITVLDKVNSPGFLAREIGRFGVQAFLTENATHGDSPDTDESKALTTVEENTYLPQIDVNAFISPDIKLSNVKTFLRNIQPKSRTFLFQVLVGTFRELLQFQETLGQDINFDVTPNLDYNPSLEIQQSDREDTETNDSTGNVLDSEGFTFSDIMDVEVYHTAVLVDSFTVEG